MIQQLTYQQLTARMKSSNPADFCGKSSFSHGFPGSRPFFPSSKFSTVFMYKRLNSMPQRLTLLWLRAVEGNETAGNLKPLSSDNFFDPSLSTYLREDMSY